MSLRNTKAHDILHCKSNLTKNSLLNVNIGTKNKTRCVSYNNKQARKHLLKNLKASINLNCSKIIPPKQLFANCWFNTMFVAFFISDKGRKFFKFFRQLMIEGKQADGKKIPPTLAKSFFMFNMAIEAAYNLNDNTKHIAYNFDTNLLIKGIFDSINKKKIIEYSDIKAVNQPGNPMDYYLSIMNYLQNTAISLRFIEYNNDFVLQTIKKYIGKISMSSEAISALDHVEYFANGIPHILAIDVMDDESKHISDKEEVLTIHTKKYGVIKYKLDSIIIRDTLQQHFCALLMCNGVELSFDGASYSRMEPFKWRKLINKNKTWGFKARHDLVWNFKDGYQILLYYRI